MKNKLKKFLMSNIDTITIPYIIYFIFLLTGNFNMLDIHGKIFMALMSQVIFILIYVFMGIFIFILLVTCEPFKRWWNRL